MAGNSAAMADGLSVLSQFFINDGTLGETLLRVAELACRVSPADMAGITMLVEGKPATGVFTDPQAPEIDTAQYESGRGPCLDAFRDQQAYRIDSTTEDVRWPEFAALAATRGVTATLSIPLHARGESLGALNLYSLTMPFDDRSAEEVEIFACQASIVLSNAQVYAQARQLSENLREAMRSRSVIDQAIGILMADGGSTPDQAFQSLARASQRENRKVRDLATEMIDRVAARPRHPIAS
jgi:GAF domain-containing protein